ncbi:MAG: PAS domain-containing protein [Deltaproteobacteria bacterium]|nr:PAS domain-containing protein [Deltaproteobacteria bacterium]
MRKEWINIPPWIIIGAVIVLAPIFLFVALENINTQKKNTTKLLIEKGAALIRSFEAGTRTGITGMSWGAIQVQRLITETALQPDIFYIFITDDSGKILAHSELSRVGQYYENGLDIESVSRSQELQWRQTDYIFEVYRKFAPLQGPQGRKPSITIGDNRLRSPFGRGKDEPEVPMTIFVGLDMTPIEMARQEDTRHTIVMMITLLLIGFAGFISLFLAQGYRSVQTSLSRIQAFSDNLVKNMPIGLLAFDRDRHITSLNQKAASLLSLSDNQSIGNKTDTVIPDQLVRLLDLTGTVGGVIEQEIECQMTKGTIIPLEVIATRLSEEDDRASGYIILFRDLTEIRHLRKEIERNRRLASIGSLAAGVAHEIRNPLSSIKGFATYFRERYRDVPDDKKTADIMVQEVDRLNRVISQLLEFARPMTVQLEPISLDNFIQRSIKMVERQAKDKDIRIATRYSPEVGNILIDPDLINQMLLNLYLNSFDAMEGGGTLSVTMMSHDKKRVRIEISDTGRGMGKSDIEKIFDPYFTTKPSGTGLGLAIVHRIVEAHRGEIRVESREGQGTTVTIILPILSEETDGIRSEDLEK